MGSPGEYEPRSVLLTGAAGFIGAHLANRLVEQLPHTKVVGLDRLDYCSSRKSLRFALSKPNFKLVVGCVTQRDLVNFLMCNEQVDTVLHLAAQTHVDTSFGSSFSYTQSNVYGTHVMLECARACGTVRRFLHVSTDEVYGESGVTTSGASIASFHGSSESHTTLQPTNPYSATKAAAEMLVKAYSCSYNLPAIITRGNNVYGPQQFPDKLIPKFSVLAHLGKKLPVHGSGSSTRSFVYVTDMAEALETVLYRGHDGEVYNVGTDDELSVLDVARAVCDHFNRDVENTVEYVDDRPFNDRRYYLDASKVKQLGWQQHTPFHKGLRRTIDWCIEHLSPELNDPWWSCIECAFSSGDSITCTRCCCSRTQPSPQSSQSSGVDAR